jgi:hypothetical protein
MHSIATEAIWVKRVLRRNSTKRRAEVLISIAHPNFPGQLVSLDALAMLSDINNLRNLGASLRFKIAP